MIYSELKTMLASLSHRSDLSARMGMYSGNATECINRRFGLALAPLVADGDTNPVLTECLFLYIFAAMQALNEDLNNGENAIYYSNRFNQEADNQNINGVAFTSTGGNAPLQIKIV